MEKEDLDQIKNEISQLLSNDKSNEEESFSLLYQLLTRTFGNKLYFCEIQGKRWAYLAGNDDMITPGHQLQLSNKYGILYDTPSDTEGWTEILNFLKHRLY